MHCLQCNYVCWITLALTGRHISQLHIVLCIILYLLFAVKVFLKTNAYELHILCHKYGVSWRRYRHQDKFNLTILSEVTSTSFQSATCNKQVKLVLNAEEKSWRDSIVNITVGRYRKACFTRSVRCTARLHFPKKMINSTPEIMPPLFQLFFSCLIPLTGVKFKMIPFFLFQWDSTSHKGKINCEWELCILQHLYTITLPSSPLYTSPSVTNNEPICSGCNVTAALLILPQGWLNNITLSQATEGCCKVFIRPVRTGGLGVEEEQNKAPWKWS